MYVNSLLRLYQLLSACSQTVLGTQPCLYYSVCPQCHGPQLLQTRQGAKRMIALFNTEY